VFSCGSLTLRLQVRDPFGAARGHVGTWFTPGVERTAWFTAGPASGQPGQPSGGLAGAAARALGAGLPLIECQVRPRLFVVRLL
jgi:hypothetical protein